MWAGLEGMSDVRLFASKNSRATADARKGCEALGSRKKEKTREA